MFPMFWKTLVLAFEIIFFHLYSLWSTLVVPFITSWRSPTYNRSGFKTRLRIFCVAQLSLHSQVLCASHCCRSTPLAKPDATWFSAGIRSSEKKAASLLGIWQIRLVKFACLDSPFLGTQSGTQELVKSTLQITIAVTVSLIGIQESE